MSNVNGVSMKKLVITSVIVIMLYAFGIVAHAETNMKLFFDGNIYPLQEAILTFDNENFIDAWEFANTVGMKYKIDNANQTIRIEFKGVSNVYDITSSSTYKPSDFIIHDKPELINKKLYFPFLFIKNNYKLVIKYNSDNYLAYIFPRDKLDNSVLKTFSNISYNYSFPVPDNVEINLSESGSNFHDSSISLKDKDDMYSAVISCNRLDKNSILQMRDYLKNYTSSDEDLFEKFSDYKDGYFRAMQEYFNKDFMYGNNDKNYSESNMKIFGEYSEKIFGQPSHVVLYNIIKSDKLSSEEETYINISIPVKTENKVFSIYSINFTVKKGELNSLILSKMSSLVNSITIMNLPKQTNELSIFLDKSSIESANLGIYPDLEKVQINYPQLVCPSLGYKISLPSVFIPYRQNNIIDSFYYKSFKIDYYNYFSISTEPTVYNNIADIANKINTIKELNKNKINTVEESVYKSSDGKEFYYIKYELSENSTKTYIQNYFIVNRSEIYNIQLNSRFIQPSQKIQEVFLKIVLSLEFFDKAYSYYSLPQPLVKFLDNEEGYSFYYPESWYIDSNNSDDINYDRFEVKNRFISGAVEISISEGELSSEQNSQNILSSAVETDSQMLNKYFKKYSSPYSDKKSKWLLTSNYYRNSETIYIVKLVNYLDTNGRNKYCYSVDAIRGNKVYSLFISASDYTTFNGKVLDKSLSAIVNLVGSTYNLETTPEYIARSILGETRNRKIVCIENFFKNKLGNTAVITTASYINNQSEIQVKLEGVPESGYYRIRLNFDKKQLDIVEFVKDVDIDKGT